LEIHASNLVNTVEDLEQRVATLEGLVQRLVSVSTRSYIALLSIPREIRDKDPDFDKSTDKISKTLDEIYDILTVDRK
jgi:hypothetical protein